MIWELSSVPTSHKSAAEKERKIAAGHRIFLAHTKERIISHTADRDQIKLMIS